MLSFIVKNKDEDLCSDKLIQALVPTMLCCQVAAEVLPPLSQPAVSKSSLF